MLHLIQNKTFLGELGYQSYIKGIIGESPFPGQRWLEPNDWTNMQKTHFQITFFIISNSQLILLKKVRKDIFDV